jgi:hypothetical protein
MKRLPRVSGELALHVLAYNLTRVLNKSGKQATAGSDQDVAIGGHVQSPHRDSIGQVTESAFAAQSRLPPPHPPRSHTAKDGGGSG